MVAQPRGDAEPPDASSAGADRRTTPRPTLGALALTTRARARRGLSAQPLVGRAAPSSGRLFASDRPDLVAYAFALIGAMVTVLPFAFASAGEVTPGLWGVPAPGVWETLGRVQALVVAGPLPLVPGEGPTSPLWLWLIAMPYTLLGWTGLPVAALAKVFGFALALMGMVALYNLAWLATGHRWPGVLALGLLVLDPAIAFGRVGGSEAPLVLALSAMAALAAVNGRATLLSLLLAGLVLARPDGALLAGIFVAVLAGDALWRRGSPVEQVEARLWEVARLAAPAAAALAVLVLFNLAVSGRPLPSADVGLEARGGSGALWWGMLAEHPTFASGFVAIALAAWLWWSRVVVTRWAAIGVLPAMMPLVLLYPALTGGAPDGAWAYDARRLVEPALPWLTVSLAVGLAAAGELIWSRSRPAGASLDLERWRPARVLALLPLLFWLLGAGLGWAAALPEYAWGARAVADGPVAAATWIAQTLPPEARLGFTPGADTVRGVGREAHRLSEREPGPDWSAARAAAEERELTHLVAYRGTTPATWPMAREVFLSETPRNLSLASAGLGVYQLNWALPQLDPSRPFGLRLESYLVVDALDVGDDASETRHRYSAGTRGEPLEAEIALPNGWIRDEGRAQRLGSGSERFSLTARADRDVILAVRYDAASRGRLRVALADLAIDWSLRECAAALCEDAIVIPAGRVHSDELRLTIGFVGIAGPAAQRIGTYHYWSIVRAQDAR